MWTALSNYHQFLYNTRSRRSKNIKERITGRIEYVIILRDKREKSVRV